MREIEKRNLAIIVLSDRFMTDVLVPETTEGYTTKNRVNLQQEGPFVLEI